MKKLSKLYTNLGKVSLAAKFSDRFCSGPNGVTERQIEFDLSGFPKNSISHAYLEKIAKHVQFESILQYVALPRLFIERSIPSSKVDKMFVGLPPLSCDSEIADCICTQKFTTRLERSHRPESYFRLAVR